MPHIVRMVCNVLVLVLLTACGGAPTPASDAPPATEETEANPDTETATTADDETETSDATTDERGTLRVAHEVTWGGIDSLDPVSPVLFLDVMRPLYDTLVRPDEHYEPAPSLATAWEPNDNATVWTFTLRDDVMFHDDTPPFDDVRVRKAMRLVADREEMIDLVAQGEGTVACDHIV